MSGTRTAGRLATTALLMILSVQSAPAEWRAATGPIPPQVVSIAEGETTLFLGAAQHDTGGPVYRSLDGGQTWILTEGATPLRLFPHHDGIVYGGGVYVGLWRSLDDGVTWSRVAGGLPTNGTGVMLTGCGTTLFAAVSGATNPAKLYRSTNDGASWSALAGGLPVPIPAADARCLGATVLAAVGNQIYRSTDVGSTWTPIGLGLPAGASVDLFSQGDGALWAGVSGDASAFGIYHSMDDGQTWSRVGLALAPPASFRFYGLTADGSELYAAIYGDEAFDSGDLGLHRSTDGGATWSRVWNGFENPTWAVHQMEGEVIVGTSGGPYRSSDGGASWTYTGIGTARIGTSPAVIANGESFLAGSVQTHGSSDIWRSTDDGTTWTIAESGLPQNVHAVAFLHHEGAVFAGVYGAGRGVYRSTNDGASWTSATTGVPGGTIIHSLHAHGDILFTGAYEALYRSTNDGQTWTAVSGGLPANPQVRALASGGATVYAGTSAAGVFRSSDGGLTWNSVNAGLPHIRVHALTQTASGLLAGLEDAGVYRWNGTSWTPAGLSGTTINAFFVTGGTLLAGGTTLAYSLDDGSSWTTFDDGFVSLAEVLSLTTNAEQLLAGTAYGLWLRPRHELPSPVAVGTEHTEAEPLLFVSPNPFHLESAILYNVPVSGHSSLRVYDVLGRTVLTLADRYTEAGEHRAVVPACALATGVYMVELRAGDHVSRIRVAHIH